MRVPALPFYKSNAESVIRPLIGVTLVFPPIAPQHSRTQNGHDLPPLLTSLELLCPSDAEWEEIVLQLKVGMGLSLVFALLPACYSCMLPRRP